MQARERAGGGGDTWDISVLVRLSALVPGWREKVGGTVS
jgi:hypothetical protein